MGACRVTPSGSQAKPPFDQLRLGRRVFLLCTPRAPFFNLAIATLQAPAIICPL